MPLRGELPRSNRYGIRGNLTQDLTWLDRRTCSDFNEMSFSDCLFIMLPRRDLNFQALAEPCGITFQLFCADDFRNTDVPWPIHLVRYVFLT